jgi:glycosyltransferase involved in cell wall biosynthesis
MAPDPFFLYNAPVSQDPALSVLHLADFEDPRVGEQVLSLAAGQRERGHTVAVAGPLNRRLQERLRRLQVRWSVLPWPSAPDAPPPPEATAQLARLLTARPPDLLHAHGLTALQLAEPALRQTPRPPASLHPAGEPQAKSPLPAGSAPGGRAPALVTSLYHFPRRLPYLERRRFRRLLRSTLGEGAALLLSSQADRQALLALLGRRGEGAQVVYPAVPETALPSGVEVGQLRRRLGLTSHAAVVGYRTAFEDAEYEIFLDAAARVHAALPNVEFAFLGDGPRRAAAQARAHERGLSGASIFLGRPRSLAEALSALNLLVVLSDAEAAHLDALQALGYGLPLVAARAGVLEELLSQMPLAHLVPPGDPEALAAALFSALHLTPRPGGDDPVVTESGRTAGLEQLLVSRDFWDLDQPWERTAHRPPAAATLPAALLPFLPAAATDRVLAVYRKILPPPD